MTELRRPKLEDENLKHIRWAIDYSGAFPVRSCNDTNILKTWSDGTLSVDSVGCDNALLNGATYCQIFAINVGQVVHDLHPHSALYSTAINLLVLLAGMIMVGESRASMLAPAVIFHLGSGVAAACLCRRSSCSAWFCIWQSRQSARPRLGRSTGPLRL
jgi:hypothetical protein